MHAYRPSCDAALRHAGVVGSSAAHRHVGPTIRTRHTGRGRTARTALLAAVLLLTGCATPGLGNETSCAGPPVEISSPVPGAQMHPGRFFATGVIGGNPETVRWVVEDASGAQVDEGRTEVVRHEGTTSYALPLPALDEGPHRLLVRPGEGPGSPSSCAAVGRDFTVVPQSTGPGWLSGASGDAVPSGEFAAWRGNDVPITGTWVDRDGGQLGLWPLQPDGLLHGWVRDLEVAVGAIEGGETWADAARGAYDERWRESLRRMAQLWAGRPGRLYIRFAHEFNGHWYPWSVTPESREDFVVAWQRFRALQRAEFPGAALVFAPNIETVGVGDLDWREAFPGAEHVDVMSMSYFNAFPFVDTPEEFMDVALRYDSDGAPQGLQRHLEFARSVGLPFAVSEWSINAEFGDTAVFVQQMDQFFRANAGPGPGRVLYEILFNVERSPNWFALMPRTKAPRAAEAYRRLW